MTETAKSPYLLGSYAPVHAEIDGACELIAGEVPRDLHGLLVRNGPNPKYEPKGRYHWFDGDGMLHAFHIENGSVRYRNRWVRTRGLAKEDAARLGLPGRTTMVGRRSERPSMKPLRVKSATRYSPTTFCVP